MHAVQILLGACHREPEVEFHGVHQPRGLVPHAWRAFAVWLLCRGVACISRLVSTEEVGTGIAVPPQSVNKAGKPVYSSEEFSAAPMAAQHAKWSSTEEGPQDKTLRNMMGGYRCTH